MSGIPLLRRVQPLLIPKQMNAFRAETTNPSPPIIQVNNQQSSAVGQFRDNNIQPSIIVPEEQIMKNMMIRDEQVQNDFGDINYNSSASAKQRSSYQSEKGDALKGFGQNKNKEISKEESTKKHKRLDITWYLSDEEQSTDDNSWTTSASSKTNDVSSVKQVLFKNLKNEDGSNASSPGQTTTIATEISSRSPSWELCSPYSKSSRCTAFTTTSGSNWSESTFNCSEYLSNGIFCPLHQSVSAFLTREPLLKEAETEDPDLCAPASFIFRNLELEQNVAIVREKGTAERLFTANGKAELSANQTMTLMPTKTKRIIDNSSPNQTINVTYAQKTVKYTIESKKLETSNSGGINIDSPTHNQTQYKEQSAMDLLTTSSNMKHQTSQLQNLDDAEAASAKSFDRYEIERKGSSHKKVSNRSASKSSLFLSKCR